MRIPSAISLCISILFLLAPAVSSPAEAQSHRWSLGIGDSNNTDWGYDVAVDADGSTYATGGFQGLIDFGDGPAHLSEGNFDIFLAKFDATGDFIWSVGFGGTGGDIGRAVAVDGVGNVVLSASFSNSMIVGGDTLVVAGGSDILLAKFDPDGNLIWHQQFGGISTDTGWSLGIGANDDIILGGSYIAFVDFGGGTLPWISSSEGFLARFTPGGAHVWSTGLVGPDEQEVNEIAVDASNNIAVTGRHRASFDLGSGNLPAFGGNDIFVALYNAAGVHQWSHGYGSTSFEEGEGVAIDGAGNVLVTGSFANSVNFGGGAINSAGSTDLFLLKLDSLGAHVWSKGFGGSSAEFPADVEVDDNDNVIAGGSFQATINFGGGPLSAGSSDIYMAQFTPDGDHMWSQSYAGSSSETLQGMDVRYGFITFAGWFSLDVDFGGGILNAAGTGSDICIVQLEGTPKSPEIVSIEDIGNDQGRWVRVTFDRASRDDLLSLTPVLEYEAYRRIDSLPAPSNPVTALASGQLADWEYVGSIPAHGEVSYSMVVPTLADSTISEGQHWSMFFVRAATSSPVVFFDSAADSGYSIDNLGPAAPMNLSLSPSGILAWGEALEEDFNYFTVYGSESSVFNGTEDIVTFTTGTTVDVGSEGFSFYHVTASDFSGNEGSAATVLSTVSVPAPGPTPARLRLLPNAPNPFSVSTRLEFDLPDAQPVRLAIFDMQGRLIRELLDSTLPAGRHATVWDGRGDGLTVSPGIYFFRLASTEGIASRKALRVE